MNARSVPRIAGRRLIGIATAVTLLVAPVTLTTAGVAQANPVPDAPRVLPAPSIPGPAAIALTGTQNTRDFTAYRTVDGRTIKGLVIRSDNLSRISPADARILTTRRVTEIVDFRTQLERSAQPDRAVPGAAMHTYDVLGATPVTTLVDLPSAYRAFVTDPSARAAFRTTLLDVARTAGRGDTLVFHCTAGKDRTGWAAAVLLTVLGVDRATVERDFLASNTFRRTSAADPINGVNIAWLRTSFATANAMYGSFDGYVRRGLGLTDRDIAGLKNALLGA